MDAALAQIIDAWHDAKTKNARLVEMYNTLFKEHEALKQKIKEVEKDTSPAE